MDSIPTFDVLQASAVQERLPAVKLHRDHLEQLEAGLLIAGYGRHQVRQALEEVELSAALEVDQRQPQPSRAEKQQEAGEQLTEEHALPRPGMATDKEVGQLGQI